MNETPIQDEWPKPATFCWGCGSNNIHGLQLKSYWDHDETVATFIPQKHHLAFPGILNGGIISTIIDCHCTGTANAYAKKHSKTPDSIMHVTASLEVKFIRPTPLNQPVTLHGKVTHDDGRKIIVTCSLYSGEHLCAMGEVVTVGVDTNLFIRDEPPLFV